ncbi:MAG: hypothetical protein K2M95_05155 [Clostridiales bacterium]|nr:hypothetical protein [Clostridiales bacterium]
MDVFGREEKNAAFREKNKLLTMWLVLLVLYVAFAVTLIVVDLYLVGVHANRSHTVWMGVVFAIATIAFFGFTLLFFAVKFRLTRKYCKMLRDMETGLKDEYEGTFLGYNDAIEEKDGVFFYTMLLKTRPMRRDDITERKVLIEHTLPKMPLTEGARIRFTTHANILVSYEVLAAAKGADEKSQQEKNEGEAAQ